MRLLILISALALACASCGGDRPTTGSPVTPAAAPGAAASDKVAPVWQLAFSLRDGRATWGRTGAAKAGIETVWIEDKLPTDAIPQGSGGDTWTWVTSDPAPFSGSASHQSAIAQGPHEHLFTLDEGLPLTRASTLFAYVYLDPVHPPTQVMLRCNQNGTWDHAAYWGDENPDTHAVHVGPLPATGTWVRLEVSSTALNLDQSSNRKPRPATPDTDGPKTLNLDGYELTFADEFDTVPDVSPWGPGTRWIAHTPWDGDFGDAAFMDPQPGFPFTVDNGILRIEARKDDAFIATDRWKRFWGAGCLASNDRKGNGFAQQYGYFVMRAKLPSGVGVWPAFWLASSFDRTDAQAGKDGTIEIDVIEYYGRPETYQSVVHVWEPAPHHAEGNTAYTSRGFCTDSFRDYGVMVEPDWITMYADGVAVWRTKTPPEHKRPLMLLLNLALGSGWPIDQVKNPTYMYVDYVRVYAKKK